MGRKDYENWLKEAKWDLETAKVLIKEKRYNTAAFYAQQAVEKLLKAALMYQNESAWGHSIRELLLRWGQITETEIEDLLNPARELDLHYIPARYPNAHPNSTPHEAYDEKIARNAINNANLFFDQIKIKLEENED
ncbi:MAG: HEPN domain-containing protein [Promethearchaeota archaeon]|nr:MAG: HEPN domain-containing protein [Candidatus Lokiarchaeota archaeon]